MAQHARNDRSGKFTQQRPQDAHQERIERTNTSSFWRPAAGLAVLAMAAHFGLSYLISTL